VTRQPLIFSTGEVVASPVDATETVIAVLSGVFTQYAGDTLKFDATVIVVPDANATDCVLLIRRDDIAGTPVGDGGPAVPFVASTVSSVTTAATGRDTPGDIAGATYVLTAQLSDATALSTIGLVEFSARCD
jgi:hypothetical protein